MRPLLTTTLSAALLFAAATGAAFAVIDGPVGKDAEKGDPARWYQPADTPQKQHENAMQEARAALAEALKECRAGSTDRAECERQARSRYEDDVESARGLLVRHNLG